MFPQNCKDCLPKAQFPRNEIPKFHIYSINGNDLDQQTANQKLFSSDRNLCRDDQTNITKSCSDANFVLANGV